MPIRTPYPSLPPPLSLPQQLPIIVPSRSTENTSAEIGLNLGICGGALIWFIGLFIHICVFTYLLVEDNRNNDPANPDNPDNPDIRCNEILPISVLCMVVPFWPLLDLAFLCCILPIYCCVKLISRNRTNQEQMIEPQRRSELNERLRRQIDYNILSQPSVAALERPTLAAYYMTNGDGQAASSIREQQDAPEIRADDTHTSGIVRD